VAARLRSVLATVTAADGTSLAVRRAGRGAPVVLVHGSAGGLDSWDPVLPLLADEFEAWVYARRGYPSSGPCRQEKTFADDVTDLEAVLGAVGGPAHVVGASYGATVALHAARSGLSGVRSVAVFEPPLFAAGAELKEVLDRYRALLAAGDLAAATRLFAGQVARVPAEILDALARAGGEPDAGRATAEALGCLHDLEAMASDELDLGRWTRIGIPVLLMQGSDTWAPMPASMDALADALPGAGRAVLTGQAHFATHTAPALFAETLRTFLRTHA
jgi:pimeloyl-ACP methyl ester carboxylesterase